MREQLQPVQHATVADQRQPPRLTALLLQLSEATDRLQGHTVDRLARHLETLNASESPDDAQALVEALEQRRFDGLIDSQGRGARQLAVEALLRLGYPWALQVTPADLDWYRAQVRRRRPIRALLLGALIAALAGLGVTWWTLSKPSPPPITTPVPVEAKSSVEVYRTESGARFADLEVEVPPSVAADAPVELGAVRVLSRSAPVEVLRFQGEGLGTHGVRGGMRTISLQVPLTPEHFEPNGRYYFVIDLWVGWKPVATAITGLFEVTNAPVRPADRRPPSMEAQWTLSAPEVPRLHESARVLLGLDSQGRLTWHQVVKASRVDGPELLSYLEGVKGRGLPMFQRRSSAGSPTGGLLDWNLNPTAGSHQGRPPGQPPQTPARPAGP